MKQRRVLSILFSLTLVAGLFSGIASAEEVKESPKAVVKETILSPVEKNESLKVTIQQLADGTQRRIFSGSGNAADNPVRLDIKVNSENNTYNVIRTDLSNDPNYQKTIEPFAPLWNKQIKLLTKDPANWDIVYTKALLYWYSQNGYPAYSTGGSATWAVKNTPLETNWYVDLEQSWRNDRQDGTAVGQAAYGSFHNYDFGDHNKGTWVTHNVYVWGENNAGFDYDAIQDITGEGELLLWSTIEIY